MQAEMTTLFWSLSFSTLNSSPMYHVCPPSSQTELVGIYMDFGTYLARNHILCTFTPLLLDTVFQSYLSSKFW